MADVVPGSSAELDDLVRATQERLAQTVDAAGIARAADAVLDRAQSLDDFARVRRSLLGLLAAADALTDAFRSPLAHVEALEREWASAHRFGPDGLEALRRDLEALVPRPSTLA